MIQSFEETRELYDEIKMETVHMERRRPPPIVSDERQLDCMTYEFQPENVVPFHEDLRLFVRPQWNISWLQFVIYRIIVAVLITIWVCIDFFDEARHFYADNYSIWFIFATNWGFLMLAISSSLRAVGATIYYLKSKYYENGDSQAERTTWYISLVWIIYNAAANSAIVVTISYWTFLTALDHSDQPGFLATHMSQLKHTLNSVYVIVDLMICATPIRIFHLIYPLFLGAIYTVFNALYFINNGVGPGGKPYAYYVMDWRNPIESAITCSLGFILTTVVQCILYGLFRFRLWLSGKVTPNPLLADPNITTNGDIANKSETRSILHNKDEDTSPAHGYNSVEQVEMGVRQTTSNNS